MPDSGVKPRMIMMLLRKVDVAGKVPVAVSLESLVFHITFVFHGDMRSAVECFPYSKFTREMPSRKPCT